jgi:hypothetical protein
MLLSGKSHASRVGRRRTIQYPAQKGGEIMSSKQKTAGLFSTMNVLGAAAFVLASATLSNAAVGDTIRVNSGADAPFTDAAGHVWAADSGFTGGQVYQETQEIAGTEDDALHTDERWDEVDFSYNFKVTTPGSYIVGLYEATLYSGACGEGTRVFDVTINGTKVLTDYDMSKEVGCLTAQVKRFVVVTNDGRINITFNKGAVENPKINAIEIYPGTVIAVSAPKAVPSKFSLSASNGRLDVQTHAEGAYTLTLQDLHGKRVDQKRGFGGGSQSFTNLRPGVYFMTSTVGGETVTRRVSVVR